MKQQLVDVYKRGRSGYARLLFGARDVREFARAARAVSSLATINQKRMAEHRRTLDALRTERAAFAQRARELQAREAVARQARAEAERAVAARTARMSEIDSRRDLTAQYVGELQVAYDKIQQQLSARPRAAPTPSPFRCFRFAARSTGRPRGGSAAGLDRPKAGSAAAPSKTASRSPRPRTCRSGPSTAGRWRTPMRLPAWARW